MKLLFQRTRLNFYQSTSPSTVVSFRNGWWSIRHKSADSVPTSNLVCIKMACILNSQSRDLEHGGTFTNECEVTILSMNSLTRMKDQVKSLVYKMLRNEIDFHRLFTGILKVTFSFLGRVLRGKSADFPAKNVGRRCLLSYVIQPRDRSHDHLRCAERLVEMSPSWRNGDFLFPVHEH